MQVKKEDRKEEIVKIGVALYDGVKKYKVRIIKSNIKYGTYDYEDEEEIQNDILNESYYVDFESLTEENTYNGKGFTGNTIEEAIKKVEELLKQKIEWII